MNTKRIDDFTTCIEEDLLEAKKLLRSGLKLALEQLKHVSGSTALLMKNTAIAEVKALEDLGEAAINDIQSKLGELSYLTAEGDIKRVEDFEEASSSLSGLLAAARRKLLKIDEIGQRELGTPEHTEISRAWRDLHLNLEIVRLQLTLTQTKTTEEAEKLRVQFEKELEQASTSSPTVEGGFNEGIRAFFLAPQKPASHANTPLK
jgi:hypothetical protein